MRHPQVVAFDAAAVVLDVGSVPFRQQAEAARPRLVQGVIRQLLDRQARDQPERDARLLGECVQAAKHHPIVALVNDFRSHRSLPPGERPVQNGCFWRIRT